MLTTSLRLVTTALVILLTATATGYSTEAADVQKMAPIAHFPISHYHFESVVDGTDIVYDFVVQNKGSAPLNIKDVRTG